MSSVKNKLEKEIQKIIYADLEVWKQHIRDLEAKKIDKTAFKKLYVEFLQKIEEKITHFTLFFLKKESQQTAQQILEDDLEKTALLETVIQFLSEPTKEIIEENTGIEPEVILHRKFQPSRSSSPIKEEQILYRASEIE